MLKKDRSWTNVHCARWAGCPSERRAHRRAAEAFFVSFFSCVDDRHGLHGKGLQLTNSFFRAPPGNTPESVMAIYQRCGSATPAAPLSPLRCRPRKNECNRHPSMEPENPRASYRAQYGSGHHLQQSVERRNSGMDTDVGTNKVRILAVRIVCVVCVCGSGRGNLQGGHELVKSVCYGAGADICFAYLALCTPNASGPAGERKGPPMSRRRNLWEFCLILEGT